PLCSGVYVGIDPGSHRQSARVAQRVNPFHTFVSPNCFDAWKAQSQTTRMSSARLDRIKRNFQDDVRLHFAIASVIRNRLLLEMFGQLGDLSVRQTGVGLSDCEELAGRLIPHREGVVTQYFIALAVAE